MSPLVIFAAVGTAIGSAVLLFSRRAVASVSKKPNTVTGQGTKLSIIDAAKKETDKLVPVQLGNDTWLVAPDYVGPIGIGEAADLAKSMGMELPTPALVDAIWRQADLKLLPMPRNNIVSQAVFDDQRRRIDEQIGGRPFTLVAGNFKDIVRGGDGFPQLYGWHVEDGKTVAGIPLLKCITPGPGKIIQPLSGHAHGLFFKDYSQGVRLVKKASASV